MSTLPMTTFLATFLTDSGGFLYRAVSLSGLLVMIGLAFVMSVDRSNIKWRPVLWGVGLQLLFAVILLNPTLQSFFFTAIDSGVRKLISFSEEGANFVFQASSPTASPTPAESWSSSSGASRRRPRRSRSGSCRRSSSSPA